MHFRLFSQNTSLPDYLICYFPMPYTGTVKQLFTTTKKYQEERKEEPGLNITSFDTANSKRLHIVYIVLQHRSSQIGS